MNRITVVLPMLNRIMAVEVRHETGDDTTMPQFRLLPCLAEELLTMNGLHGDDEHHGFVVI